MSELRGSSYKRSVPMLCPSNGDVLATPLASIVESTTAVYAEYVVGILYTSGRCGNVCSGLLNVMRLHFRTSPLLYHSEKG